MTGPFAITTSSGQARILDRFELFPTEGALPLPLEEVAFRLNRAQGLAGMAKATRVGILLRDLMATRPAREPVLAAHREQLEHTVDAAGRGQRGRLPGRPRLGRPPAPGLGCRGLVIRGGPAWRPYERLSPSRQEAMLHAAATAVHLAADGAITAPGTLGSVLRLLPSVPRTSLPKVIAPRQSGLTRRPVASSVR
ncbi:hypothetical protein [Nonomuraea sp. GTA35]|uniref:hypothetical protein n=1 Tax=Nonomuraea sp. GTA35 TaxID=1676746 RepID=UPI0035C02107